MSPVFLLLPGITRWELVEVELQRPLRNPRVSGRLPRPAVVRASGGPAPSIQREPRK